ncbi:putative phospholipid hydroperoxide glutathione peroxidase [Carex littledalei]|uniref:Glutathione peroxidase n=1 Tax=Carex littledalei TaxID=544730 RepID=A0A833RFA5_9POAL|nr:putative phospholipid hydroperoxide glutathione peroxidase [Carex littledalei]
MLSSRFIFPKNTNICRHYVKHLSSYPTKCFLIPTYSLRNSTRLSRALISRINTSQSFSPCLSVRSASMASQSTTSVHDFTVKDAKGNDVDLSIYKGKVLLIVNVASQCGLTNSNYTELSQLYEKYKDQGFEILAFPCNQFGGQEPGTNEDIVQFACTRFKAEYPIFDKVDVNGEKTAPIYKFLKSSKGGLFGDGIKWNFSKFLVDKEGHVVDRYAPTTSPLSIEKDLKKLVGTTA